MQASSAANKAIVIQSALRGLALVRRLIRYLAAMRFCKKMEAGSPYA